MGWNGSDRALGTAATTPSPAAKKAPAGHHGLVIGLVAVVGATLAVWFVLREPESGGPKQEKRAKATSTERSASAKPKVVQSSSEVAIRQADGVDVTTSPEKGEPVRSAGARVSAAPEEPASTNADDAAVKDHLNLKPTFKNGVEQLLDMVTPSSPGARIPPLPIITDEGLKDELKRALKNIPKATADDTEDSIRRKLAVEDRKDDFVEVNKETGMTIAEYVQAVRDQHNDNADFMAEAHKLDEEIKGDASVSDADYKSAHNQINAALEEKGLPKIESEVDEVPPDNKESSE